MTEFMSYLPLFTAFCAVGLSLCYFIVAFFTDLLFQEIPSFRLLGICYLFAIPYLMFEGLSVFAINFIGAVIMFSMLYIFVKYFNLGGGDALSIPLLVLLWGIHDASVVLLAGCIVSIVMIVIKALFSQDNMGINKTKCYPMLPGVSICYCVYLMLTFIFV